MTNKKRSQTKTSILINIFCNKIKTLFNERILNKNTRVETTKGNVTRKLR